MTDLWYPGGPEPPRLWPLWEAVAERLRSEEMERLLEPYQGRVFGAHEDESEMVRLSAPWARVVILPVSQGFDPPDQVGADREVPWLVRADLLAPTDRPGFDPLRILEALQAEAWRRLRGWLPGALDHVEVHLPVWRATAPQALALWDERAGTHFLSAEYRALAEPLTPEPESG
jgi:hypothetical protein